MSVVKKSENQGLIKKNIERPDKKVIEKILSCYSGIISDITGKSFLMDHKIKPLIPNTKLCGPAITVQGSDLSLRRMAINLAKKGDVIVINPGINCETALYGDGTALKMKLKGIAGMVIDGYTRDLRGIRDLDYPVFVKGVNARNFHYPIEGEFGSINVPIVCGNQLVRPGDLIFGDDDGIVVIPFEIADRIAEEAFQIHEAEKKERSLLTEFDQFEGIEEELLNRGYTIKE